MRCLKRRLSEESGLVFTTSAGTEMDAANVRRDLRRALALVPGIRGTTVTELIYRHQLRPVLQTGGTVMDKLFVHRDGSA
jgi:hypothetical protein